jgi:hypothetical protein
VEETTFTDVIIFLKEIKKERKNAVGSDVYTQSISYSGAFAKHYCQ